VNHPPDTFPHHKETAMLAKRSLLVGAAALLVLILGASLAVASSKPSTTTLRFDVRFQDQQLDLGAPGPSAGDQFLLHDVLVDHRGRQVGHDGGVCSLTDPAAPELHCTVTFWLPNGQITTQFLNTPPPRKRVAVTGGTGAYRHAGGEAILVENPDQTGVITFHLTL
jgi:hypothetical protein